MTDRLPTEPLRIFIAGASGVVGIRVVPLLVGAGHVVAGMTRTASKAARLRDLGAEPVVCDVFDAEALRDALVRFGPDVVLHELTDLPDARDEVPGRVDANARIRREGTHNLLTAMAAAGPARMLAQSIAWQRPRWRPWCWVPEAWSCATASSTGRAPTTKPNPLRRPESTSTQRLKRPCAHSTRPPASLTRSKP